MTTFDVNRDLAFEVVESKPKTKVYEVSNTQVGCVIGEIRWYGPWRHYCFFPETETTFSDRCLLKIGRFIEALNKEHQKMKAKGGEAEEPKEVKKP